MLLAGLFLLCIATFAVVLVSYFQEENRLKSLGAPPGPQRLPLIGSLHHLNAAKLHESFAEVNQKYGPVAMVKLGSMNLALLGSTDIIKETFVDHGKEMVNRVPSDRFGSSELGMTFSNGDIWRQSRAIFVRRLMTFVNTQQDEILSEVDLFAKEIEALADKEEYFNPSERLQEFTLRVISRVAFGKSKFFTDDVLRVVLKNTKMFADLIPAVLAVSQLPRSLRWLAGSQREKFEQVQEDNRVIYRKVFEEHEAVLDPENPKDFVDLLLMKQDETNLDRDSLIEILADTLSAGTTTTSAHLEWIVILMAMYPDVQESVYAELRSVFQKNNTLRTAAEVFESLPLFSAVLKESIRFGSIIPYSVGYWAAEDIKVGGYTIPKESMIMANIWLLQQSPKLWKDPEKFNPQRFLNEEKGIDLKASETRQNVSEYKLLPFGAGRRACAGAPLARLEVSLAASQLLYRFKWTLPVRDENLLKRAPSAALRPQPFKVLASKRAQN